MHTSQLINILPTLALLGMALTGIESAPNALAHGAQRRDHHKHLAARQRLETQVSKKRSTGLVRRAADGSACRVRGSSPPVAAAPSAAAPSPEAAAASPAPSADASSAAAPAPSESPAWSEAAAADTAAPASSAAAWSAPAAASSAAATSSYTPAPASNGGWSNTGEKYGMAWPNGDWSTQGQSDFIGNYIGSRASWYYTWSPHNCGSGDGLGLEFVPMLWGPHQLGDWHSLQNQWPGAVKSALFFNEPNESGQANISPQDSVGYWMNDYLPVRQKGIRLGGAATTSAPSGLQWVLDFERLCVEYGNSAADCRNDFLPLHWYDVSVDGFQQYVQNFHDKTGHNIWVTEYACQNFNGGAQCSDDQTWNLHVQMAAWFDQQDWVERYAPFGAMKNMQGVQQNNALMNPDGSITALGSWYMNSG